MRIHSRLVSCTANTLNENVDSGIKQSKTVDVLCRPLRVDLLQAAVTTVGRLRQQCYVAVASTTVVVVTVTAVRLASWRVLRLLAISSGADTERRRTRPTATGSHRRRRGPDISRRWVSSSTTHTSLERLSDYHHLSSRRHFYVTSCTVCVSYKMRKLDVHLKTDESPQTRTDQNKILTNNRT